MQKGIELVGDDLGGGYKWGGSYEGVDSSGDLCIYGIPFNANKVLKYNTVDKSTTLIGDDLGGDRNKFLGGAVGLDGCIYGAPSSSKRILKIDPKDDSAKLVGSDLGSSKWKWGPGVCAPDGCLYFSPLHSNKILKYDPVKDESSYVGEDLGAIVTAKYLGCVLGKDNCIYFVPFSAKKVMRYDPSSGETTYFGDSNHLSGDSKWLGGVVGKNNRFIYCFPFAASQFLKIDTQNKSTSLVGNELSKKWGKFTGGVRTSDGVLYSLPRADERILRFDPETEKTEYMGDSFPGDCKWEYPVLASDGFIYGVPMNVRQVIKVKPDELQPAPVSFSHDGVAGGTSDTAAKGIAADRLGYAQLAKGLCTVARKIEQPHSSVCVGIYGPWGSGKSFMWNLIQDEYEQQEKSELELRIVQKDDNNTETPGACRHYLGCNNGYIQIPSTSDVDDTTDFDDLGFRAISKMVIEDYYKCINVNIRQLLNKISSIVRCWKPIIRNKYKIEDNPKHLFITFNAWVYSGTDLLWASLLEKMWSTVEDEFGRLQVRLHRAKVRLNNEDLQNNDAGVGDLKTRERNRSKALIHFQVKIGFSITCLTAFAIFLLINPTSLNFQEILTGGVLSFLGSVPFFSSFFSILPLLLKSQGKGILQQVKSFEKYDRESFVAETGFMGKVKRELTYLYDFLQTNYIECDEYKCRRKVRLTAFIDDLDRCPKETIMSVLEAVILLLVDAPISCYLGIDTRVVVASIEDHFGEKFAKAGLDGYEFLEKIVQLPFCLPDLDDDCKINFITKTLNSSELDVMRVYKRAVFLHEKSTVEFFAQFATPDETESVEKKVELRYLYKVFEAMVRDIGFFPNSSSSNTLSSPGTVLERFRIELINNDRVPVKQTVEEFLYFVSKGIEMKLAEHRKSALNTADTTDQIQDVIGPNEANLQDNEGTDEESIGEDILPTQSNDISGYSKLFQPLVNEEEMKWFYSYYKYFIGKPRKIKRNINSYMVAREIANERRGNSRANQVFRGKLLKFLVLTEQWPYRMAWLMIIVENLQQEKGFEKREHKYLPGDSGKSIRNILRMLCKDGKDNLLLDLPLLDVYQSVVYVLMHSPPDADIQVYRDEDPQIFVQILSDDELNSRLLLKDIALFDENNSKTLDSLRPYMFNLPRHMLEKVSIHLENCVLQVKGNSTRRYDDKKSVDIRDFFATNKARNSDNIKESSTANDLMDKFTVQYERKRLLFDRSSTNMSHKLSE